MKVYGSGGVDKVNLPAKKKKSSAGGFGEYVSSADVSANESTGSISNVHSLASASALFSLQEVNPSSEKEEILRKGAEGIELLAQLQSQLLTGELNSGTLQEMRSQLSQIESLKSQSTDLNRLIDDIKLRLAVEVAKLERVED